MNRAREILAAQHDEIFAGARRDSILKSIWTVEDDLKALAAMEAYATELVAVERERAAAVADKERDYRRECQAKALNKREARDFESMAIACVQVASAIRTPVGDE